MPINCKLIALIQQPEIYIQILVIAIFLSLLLMAPTGHLWDRSIGKALGEVQKLKEIMTTAQEFEKNLLSSFSDKLSSLSPVDKLKYAGDRISKAIDYASRRHDWYEDQRAKMFQGTVTISSAIFIVAGRIAKDFSNHGVPIALLFFGHCIDWTWVCSLLF
jgi:hypothetical protein